MYRYRGDDSLSYQAERRVCIVMVIYCGNKPHYFSHIRDFTVITAVFDTLYTHICANVS